MQWIWLAIAAQSLWGICDVLDKIIRERFLRDSLVLAAVLGIAAMPTSFVIGAIRGYELSDWTVALAIASGLLSPLSFLFYFRALAIEEASRVVPLFQLSPLWTLAFGALLLGDRLPPIAYLAFASILAGGVLVSVQRGGGGLRLSPAFLLMLACTLIYGSTQILAKFAFSSLETWDVVKWTTLGYGLGGLAFLLAPDIRRRFIAGFRQLRPLGAGLLAGDHLALSSTARVLNVFALATGPVALVSVMNAFQSVVVLVLTLLGSIFLPQILREDIAPGTVALKIAALALVITGVALLNLEGLGLTLPFAQS